MAAKLAFENERISKFEGFGTLSLTFDRVILHTIVYHSSTSTYNAKFHWNQKKNVLWTDEYMYACMYIRMYVHMDGRTFDTGFIRSTQSNSWPKKQTCIYNICTSLHESTHHSIFYKPDALPHTYPTVSRHGIQYHRNFITTVLLFHYHLPVV